MNPAPTAEQEQRLIWAFWAAAALAAVGGLMPIVFAGASGRLSGVLVPFWAAAIAFGACAVLHRQGRIVTSIVYFIAGLAIVFGLLAMFSLPLRLAVLGTCPALPAPCTTGLPRPLTDAENTGMGAAATLGILAVFIGFLGLTVMYRRAVSTLSAPPQRRIPAMPAVAPTKPVEPEAPPEPAPEPVAVQARKPESQNSHPPDDEPELPAHEEPPELPPHESQ